MERGTVTKLFTPSATGVQAQSQFKAMEVCAGARKALPFPAPAGTPAFMLAATADDWAAVQAEEMNQLINLK